MRLRLTFLVLVCLVQPRVVRGQYAITFGDAADDTGYSVAVDGSGNSYVTGVFQGTVDFDPGPGTANRTSNGLDDVFVASYDASGGLRFAISFGSGSSDLGRGIAVDGSGNSYVTGGFQGTVDFDPGAGTANRTSSGGNDAFVASYDNSGTFRFATTFGSGAADQGVGIDVDGSGNSYVTGVFQGTVDFDPGPGTASRTSNGNFDVFVASYDDSGSLLFASTFGGTGADQGFGLTVDGSGNSYVTGNFQGTADFDPGPGTVNRTSNGGIDAYVASYDASGNLRFASTFGGSSTDQGFGLAVDGSGNSYVTGGFQGTADFDPGPGTASRTSNGNFDIFIASYDDSGNFRFASTFGGSSIDVGWSLAVDGSGNSYVTGGFQGTADFDPGPGTASRTSSGADDIFVANYDATGSFLFASAVGGGASDQGFGIAVDAGGSSYVTGRFQAIADFDPEASVANRTSNGGNDVFVLNLLSDGTLPVELVRFDAVTDGRSVLLAWETASETNNAGFEVQRRSGASKPDWQVLTFIDGRGTTAEPQHYSYRATHLDPGSHVFRLKQIDYDGTSEYSPEVEVVVGLGKMFMLEPVYPNPFNDSARFRFAVERQQPITVALYDMLGRRVRLLYEGEPSAGQMQEVHLDAGGLPSGRYTVRVAGSHFAETLTLTLLR